MLRKALFVFIISLMLCCGGLQSAWANNNHPITVWCWGSGFNTDAIHLAAQRYQTAHPQVSFEIKTMDRLAMLRELYVLMECGETKSLPDIMLLEDYWVQNFLFRFSHYFYDLIDDLPEDRFFEHKLKISSYHGGQYGVPFDAGIAGLFVRQDLFYQAGFNEHDFQNLTWDRFIEMGRQVKRATGVSLLSYSPANISLVRALLIANGEWFTQGHRIHLNDNKVLYEIFSLYKKLNDADLLVCTQDFAHYIQSYHEDKIASGIIGSWFTPTLDKGKKKHELWHLYAIPTFTHQSQQSIYTTIGGSQWYVNGLSKQAKTAADFVVQTFGKDNELLNKLKQKYTFISSLKNPSQLTNYHTNCELFDGQDIDDIFTYWSTQIPEVDYGPWNYQLDTIIAESLQRVLSGEDIQAVLDEAQFNAEQQLHIQATATYPAFCLRSVHPQ